MSAIVKWGTADGDERLRAGTEDSSKLLLQIRRSFEDKFDCFYANRLLGIMQNGATIDIE